MSITDYAKKCRISNISVLEDLMKRGAINNIFDIKVKIITRNYEYLTKYSLKKVKTTDTFPGYRYI